MRIRIFLILIPLLLAACADQPIVGPQDVVKIACEQGEGFTVERCAKSINDVYVQYLREIQSITADPATPEDVKSALKEVNEKVTPIFRELSRLNVSYVQARDSVPTDNPIAQRNLWMLQSSLIRQTQIAQPALVDLDTEIGRAK